MKEIIKKRWNGYKQIIFYICTFGMLPLCYATFFSSISDKGYRNMMKGEFQYLMCFFAGLLLKEVIGATLEFRQKIVKKDHNN